MKSEESVAVEAASGESTAGPASSPAGAGRPRTMTVRQSMPLLFGIAAGAGMSAFYTTALIAAITAGAAPSALTLVFQLSFTVVGTFGALMIGFLAWGALAWLGIGTGRVVGRGTLTTVLVVALVLGVASALMAAAS